MHAGLLSIRPLATIFSEILIKYNIFHSWRYKWKYHLQNDGHFVQWRWYVCTCNGLFSWSGAVFEIEMSPLSHQTCKDLTISQTSCLPHETETIKYKTRLYIPLRPCAGTSQIPMFFAHFRCSLGASLIFTNIRTMGFVVILTLFLTVQIRKKSDLIHVQH